MFDPNLRWLQFLLISELACSVGAQVLFDGAQTGPPAMQGWDYFARQGVAVLTQVEGHTRLDTQSALAEQAGFFRLAPVDLDSATGFAIEFVVALESEQHQSPHRAGFSILVLDRQARGIELGFWRDQVFAQAGEPLFTRAEEAPMDWTDPPLLCALALAGNTYTLHVGGKPRLTGPIRDYSAFTGIPDVYEIPNLLFLGDNTTSAAAVVALHRVALITPVRLEWSARAGTDGLVLQWQGVPDTAYTVESSHDGRQWVPDAIVQSDSPTFQFFRPNDHPIRFIRTRYP